MISTLSLISYWLTLVQSSVIDTSKDKEHKLNKSKRQSTMPCWSSTIGWSCRKTGFILRTSLDLATLRLNWGRKQLNFNSLTKASKNIWPRLQEANMCTKIWETMKRGFDTKIHYLKFKRNCKSIWNKREMTSQGSISFLMMS